MLVYRYIGPISHYNNILVNTWECETTAISRDKALNNFKYKARLYLRRTKNFKLDLPGKIIELED